MPDESRQTPLRCSPRSNIDFIELLELEEEQASHRRHVAFAEGPGIVRWSHRSQLFDELQV
jgi:hypothetical protein